MTNYEKGTVVTGYVTGIEEYGVFVGLDDYYSGLIHISEVSNNFVRNINDYVNIGETINVKVVDRDDAHHQVKLSIKDIDYRINQKKTHKIEETPNGFTKLGENLDFWIAEKINEINEKNQEKM